MAVGNRLLGSRDNLYNPGTGLLLNPNNPILYIYVYFHSIVYSLSSY